jgi:hypothetical protein
MVFASFAASAQTRTGSAPPRPLQLPIEGAAVPQWTEMPTADQMSDFYPKLAWALSLTGQVKVICQQTPSGALEHCLAASERPNGLGFGKAAVLLSAYFRAKPDQSADEVQFTINFRMPPAEGDATAYAPPAPTTKERLDLGRRLAAAMQASSLGDIEQRCRKAISDQIETAGATVTSPAAAEALRAFGEACQAATPAFQEQLAEVLAQTYSESELSGILAFVQSSAGKAWLARSNSVQSATTQAEATVWKSVFRETGQRLCKAIGC